MKLKSTIQIIIGGALPIVILYIIFGVLVPCSEARSAAKSFLTTFDNHDIYDGFDNLNKLSGTNESLSDYKAMIQKLGPNLKGKPVLQISKFELNPFFGDVISNFMLHKTTDINNDIYSIKYKLDAILPLTNGKIHQEGEVWVKKDKVGKIDGVTDILLGDPSYSYILPKNVREPFQSNHYVGALNSSKDFFFPIISSAAAFGGAGPSSVATTAVVSKEASKESPSNSTPGKDSKQAVKDNGNEPITEAEARTVIDNLSKAGIGFAFRKGDGEIGFVGQDFISNKIKLEGGYRISSKENVLNVELFYQDGANMDDWNHWVEVIIHAFSPDADAKFISDVQGFFKNNLRSNTFKVEKWTITNSKNPNQGSTYGFKIANTK